MTNEEKERRKFNQKRGTCLLAALAIEHGLLLLVGNDPVITIIKEDIQIVRTGSIFQIQSQYTTSKRRKTKYKPDGLLLQGSMMVLRTAEHNNPITGTLLAGILYYPCEAAMLLSESKRKAEDDWHQSVIYPMQKAMYEDYGNDTVIDEIERLSISK